jgi:Leucine-rich repeat (LRR) protein
LDKSRRFILVKFLKASFAINFIPQPFRPLTSLQELDLSWNGISDNQINFTDMWQLKNLSLAGNWFLFFPNFCDKNNKSIMPNLVELHLENSKIRQRSERVFLNVCYKVMSQLNFRYICANQADKHFRW